MSEIISAAGHLAGRSDDQHVDRAHHLGILKETPAVPSRPFSEWKSGRAFPSVPRVEDYVILLKSVDRKATKAVLERAAIAAEALSALSEPDKSKLVELSGWSRSKLSKHLTIHENRDWLLQHLDSVPAEWTVVYKICLLSDHKRKRLVEERRLRPDLTAQQIEDYELATDRASPVGDGDTAAVTPVTQKASKNEQRLNASKSKARTIALIRAYGEVDEKPLRGCIKRALKRVLKGKQLKLEFPERKSTIKEKNRETLAVELTEDLTRRLRSHKQAKAKFSKQSYQTVGNAAWQHQHKFKTGRFPYGPTEVASVEHPQHPYSITKPQFATRQKLLGWMQMNKIITAYNPIPDNPALVEETCMKFAIEYCEVKTAKARRTAKAALDKLAKSNSPTKKKHAEKYLQLLDRRGAL